MTSQNKLSIALVVDQNRSPAWVCRIISEIVTSQVAQINLVIRLNSSENAQGNSILCKSIFHKIICKFENIFIKPEANAFALQDISPLISNINILDLNPQSTHVNGTAFSRENLRTIQSHKLDVLIYLGDSSTPDSLASLAKYGLWLIRPSIHLGYKSEPVGYWEVANRNPVTECILWMLTGTPPKWTALMTHYSSTQSYPLKNANHIYWAASILISKKLTDLYLMGEDGLRLHQLSKQNQNNAQRSYYLPGNLDVFKASIKLSFDTILYHLKKFFLIEQYGLMVSHFSPNEGIKMPGNDFIELFHHKNKSWADPFIFTVNNKVFVFFEEFKRNIKGFICVIELNSVGKIINGPVKVLEKEYHLSYPFVFGHENIIYMLPETGNKRVIELYRSINFPHEWENEATLISDIKAVDTTLFKYDNKWWMFTNIARDFHDGYRNYDELHIYYSDRIRGPWIAHKLNPVKSDVRSARSAGKVINLNGDLFRPAQDCSVRYGYAIVINKINKLSPDEYQETEVSRILPNWKKGLLGIHTINIEGNIIVYDFKSYRLRFHK